MDEKLTFVVFLFSQVKVHFNHFTHKKETEGLIILTTIQIDNKEKVLNKNIV